MNDTTEQENMQDLTPEEAKASLGLATRLGEQHLMSMMPQEEAQPQETPPEATEAPPQGVDVENEEMAIDEETDVNEGEYEDASEEMADMKTDIELLKKAIIKE